MHVMGRLGDIGLQICHEGGGHIKDIGGKELGRQDLWDTFRNGCELFYQLPRCGRHVRHRLVSDSMMGALVCDLDSQGL